MAPNASLPQSVGQHLCCVCLWPHWCRPGASCAPVWSLWTHWQLTAGWAWLVHVHSWTPWFCHQLIWPACVSWSPVYTSWWQPVGTCNRQIAFLSRGLCSRCIPVRIIVVFGYWSLQGELLTFCVCDESAFLVGHFEWLFFGPTITHLGEQVARCASEWVVGCWISCLETRYGLDVAFHALCRSHWSEVVLTAVMAYA